MNRAKYADGTRRIFRTAAVDSAVMDWSKCEVQQSTGKVLSHRTITAFLVLRIKCNEKYERRDEYENQTV